jgi:hypothetical protein
VTAALLAHAAEASMLLAHQGGWDEIALVATPIALFAGLLWLANRRAEAHRRADGGAQPEADPEKTVPPPPA